MTTEILSGQLGELRAASTAAGGTALAATASAFISLPKGSYYIMMTARNFTTAVVAKVSLNPYLTILKVTDNMNTAPSDQSSAVQDANASTLIDMSEMPTLASGAFGLVGSHLPFRGCYLTMVGTNSAGTATMTVHYWNGTAWTDTSATDGTLSTRTLAQSGLVYWAVPSAWTPATLKSLYPHTPDTELTKLNYYWTRWSVSAALTDTSVTVSEWVAANRSTAYAELIANQSYEKRINLGRGGIGCVEALTDAGTGYLIVNVGTSRDGHF